MARDAELDRLRAAQDIAFQRKQDAYDAMQQAWDRRSREREELNRAHEAKQSAYAEQDRTWQRLQSIRDANGPRIESLNSQQESAYQNMKRSFEAASSAYERGDKASAKSYSEEGHRYKAESQGYVAQRRRLVEEIRQTRDEHEATKPAFQSAKENFASAKRRFDAEKAAHERAQEAFKQAKVDFDRAQSAFRSRLEKVKAETAKRKESKRAIAEKAGVPIQYRDNVWISTEPDGTTNVYFGGVGKPNGPGHGHRSIDPSGKVTYSRGPFDPHGAQNFTENRREGATLAMARMTMNQWAKTQTTPRMTQFEDGEFKVDVRSGYDRRHDCIVTDVLIYDKQNKREHYHLVIDENGRELFSEWRLNH